MRSSEYCFEVYVENESGLREFTLPKQFDTVWGEATRASEFGKYFWSNDLFVVRGELNLLYKRLPADRHAIDYRVLHCGGDFFNRRHVRFIRQEEDELEVPVRDDRGKQLGRMLEHLCSRSDTWAIFALAGCDDLDVTRQTDLHRAVELIDAFVFEETSELDGGFCIISA